MRLSLCPSGCQESYGFEVDYQLRGRLREIRKRNCSSVEACLLRAICRSPVPCRCRLRRGTIDTETCAYRKIPSVIEYQVVERVRMVGDTDVPGSRENLERSRSHGYSIATQGNVSGDAEGSGHIQRIHRNRHADADVSGVVYDHRVASSGTLDVKLVVCRGPSGPHTAYIDAVVVHYRSASFVWPLEPTGIRIGDRAAALDCESRYASRVIYRSRRNCHLPLNTELRAH